MESGRTHRRGPQNRGALWRKVVAFLKSAEQAALRGIVKARRRCDGRHMGCWSRMSCRTFRVAARHVAELTNIRRSRLGRRLGMREIATLESVSDRKVSMPSEVAPTFSPEFLQCVPADSSRAQKSRARMRTLYTAGAVVERTTGRLSRQIHVETRKTNDMRRYRPKPCVASTYG